jgi:hypothetical protein
LQNFIKRKHLSTVPLNREVSVEVDASASAAFSAVARPAFAPKSPLKRNKQKIERLAYL